MKIGDLIALVAAVIAVLALFISIYSAYVTQRVATSGFQSSEHVKSDTATLLATLRAIIIKGVLYTQEDKAVRDDPGNPDYIDIRPEKAMLQTFLSSPTAIAYYAFVAKKSRQATDAGRQGEEWRVFFLRLGQLMSTANQYAAAQQAAHIEKMFDTLTDEDIEGMSEGLEDLVGSIKSIMNERLHDPIFNVVVDKPGEQAIDAVEFVKYLREHGVKDPDVDLFWSAGSGDLDLTKDALARGAKINITDSEIIARYPEQLKSYLNALQKGH
jgi:hypothetical protein